MASKMPFVKIHYGPYLAHGLIQHRVQKINGLFAQLDRLGFEIEVIAINEYNRLSIEMFDREVFRCDIRNLMFNMPCEDDPVCQRAAKAIEEAKSRMCKPENKARYGSITRGSRDLKHEQVESNIAKNLPSRAELMYEVFPPKPAPIKNEKEVAYEEDVLK